MEQKQAKNDQQATNAVLAALAATGNTFALGQLWEVNKGFIRRQLWQWFEKNKPVAGSRLSGRCHDAGAEIPSRHGPLYRCADKANDRRRENWPAEPSRHR